MAHIPSPPFCKRCAALLLSPSQTQTRPPIQHLRIILCYTTVLFMQSHPVSFCVLGLGGRRSYARAQFFRPIAKGVLAPANLSGPRSYLSIHDTPNGTTVADLSCQQTLQSNQSINLSIYLGLQITQRAIQSSPPHSITAYSVPRFHTNIPSLQPPVEKVHFHFFLCMFMFMFMFIRYRKNRSAYLVQHLRKSK
jgi:hypothetical protein